MVIFHSYVSLPEGKSRTSNRSWGICWNAWEREESLADFPFRKFMVDINPTTPTNGWNKHTTTSSMPRPGSQNRLQDCKRRTRYHRMPLCSWVAQLYHQLYHQLYPSSLRSVPRWSPATSGPSGATVGAVTAALGGPDSSSPGGAKPSGFRPMIMIINLIIIIEGSLEVKLPTIWTVEKQRWKESEEKRSEERRGRCAKR